MRRQTTLRAVQGLALVWLGSWSIQALAAPGDHIRAGDAVITPSVMTGVEHHTNVYLADGRDSLEYPGTAWLLHPRLALDLEGADLEMTMGAGWAMRKYLDFHPDSTPFLENLDRFSDVDANVGISALNRNVLGLRLDNRFEIQNTPSELETYEEGSANTTHLSNDLNAGVAVRPGSALEVNVLGNFGIDRYDVPEVLVESTAQTNVNNRANYGPVLDVRWKFLPKTSLLWTSSLNWLRWDYNLIEAIGPEVEGANYGSYIGKPDAFAWRTALGLRGQFTSKLAVGTEFGFGQMYYDEETVLASAGDIAGSSAELSQVGEETFARDLTSFGEGFTVNAQVAYSPAKGHTVTTGYRKDFQDAFFTNYVAYNYGFLRYEGLFASRFGVTTEVSYRFDAFHGEVARDDQNIRAKLNGAYRFNDYLSASLGGGWARRACGDKYCEDGVFYPTQYDDVWVTGGATFTY